MWWGANFDNYMCNSHICRYYGDKKCPCRADKGVREKYNKVGGLWTAGEPLPECEDCTLFEDLHDIPDGTYSISDKLTELEKHLWFQKQKKIIDARKEEKVKGNTPVKATILSASGGTAAERVSKMIIGGALLGGVGALMGLLGSNAGNVNLIFKVDYADGSSKIVTTKANSKEAKQLLKLVQ